MDDRKLLKTGVGGIVITVICCATPVLAVVLGAVGLSAWVGWADYALIPALLMFVVIAVYAVARRRRRRCELRDQDGRPAGGSAGAGAESDGAA